jgi:hypothetical protein
MVISPEEDRIFQVGKEGSLYVPLAFETVCHLLIERLLP